MGSRISLALALLGLGLGCVAIEHGRDAAAVTGRPLAARSAEGSRWLAREAEMDPTVKRWLEEQGRPDFLYVESRMKLYLFYTADDRAAMFERELAESRVTDLGRIPGSLLRMLPTAQRERIVADRKAASDRARAKARAEARRRPRQPGPAAAAPGGVYFGRFDLNELAERMRPPLSAADPGVRSWSRSKLSDGRQRWLAKVGGTRYELRSDAVSVATPAKGSRRSLPGSARVGIRRVNEAVFTAKAESVTQAMTPLVEKVLRDASGRTRFSRRVAGRTIVIRRIPAEGRLLYSVHP